MTTLYRNTGSAWVEVADGSLKFRSVTTIPQAWLRTTTAVPSGPSLVDFLEPSEASVRTTDSAGNPVWLNVGYQQVLAAPGAPVVSSFDFNYNRTLTDPTSKLVVSWSDPTSGHLPTKYWVTVYKQDGSLLQRKEVPFVTTKSYVLPPVGLVGSNFSVADNYASFDASPPLAWNSTLPPPVFLHPDTNYYVQVESVRTGFANTKSSILKFRMGHAATVVTQSVYGWLPKEESVHPVASSYTSRLDASHSVTAVTDDGPAGGGPLAPFTTQWISDYHDASTGAAAIDTYWEGISLTMPTGKRLLTKVQVVTEPQHTLLLGINKNGTWLGSATASSLGIAATGYRTAAYAPLLVHNYAARHTDHTTNLKVINTLPLNVEFADIDQLVLAVKDFIAIGSVGGSAGTQVLVSPAVAAVPGFSLLGSGYNRMELTVDNGGSIFSTIMQFKNGSGVLARYPDGTLVTRKVYPPAGFRPWIVGVAPNQTMYYRYLKSPYPANDPSINPSTGYLLYSDGSPHHISMSAFDAILSLPGTPGSPAVYKTVGGSPPTPAWRARISDVTLFYKPWGVTGTQRVTTVAEVKPVFGASAW